VTTRAAPNNSKPTKHATAISNPQSNQETTMSKKTAAKNAAPQTAIPAAAAETPAPTPVAFPGQPFGWNEVVELLRSRLERVPATDRDLTLGKSALKLDIRGRLLYLPKRPVPTVAEFTHHDEALLAAVTSEPAGKHPTKRRIKLDGADPMRLVRDLLAVVDWMAARTDRAVGKQKRGPFAYTLDGHGGSRVAELEALVAASAPAKEPA
jgi:hypothetical protein